MWKYNETEELYHWGILGMKWGHRKNNPIKEIKRYNTLKKRNDRKTKLENKRNSENRALKKELVEYYNKKGYTRTNNILKATRVASAGASILAGLNAVGFTKRAVNDINKGNKRSAAYNATLAALSTLSYGIHAKYNKEARKQQSMLNDIEYEKLNKKYKKIIK